MAPQRAGAGLSLHGGLGGALRRRPAAALNYAPGVEGHLHVLCSGTHKASAPSLPPPPPPFFPRPPSPRSFPRSSGRRAPKPHKAVSRTRRSSPLQISDGRGQAIAGPIFMLASAHILAHSARPASAFCCPLRRWLALVRFARWSGLRTWRRHATSSRPFSPPGLSPVGAHSVRTVSLVK